MASDVMQQAVEVFARGFCFTRSFTHPYLTKRVGKMWLMRDAPRKRGDYRREEWIAHGVAPKKIDQIARKHTRGRFCVCAIYGVDESDESLRTGFKALGYRLGATEAVMVHKLKRIPRFETPAKIVRVKTAEMAECVNKAAGAWQILPEHLVEDAPLRQYVALVDDEPVGWVRSIDAARGTWCSNMFVDAQFRRQGIGRALMAQMLRDDRKSGSQWAVLTASHVGAMLYPVVGYEQIGTLMLYMPKKR